MIRLPFRLGSVHRTTTLSPLFSVVGAEGVPGTAVTAPVPSDDSKDSPKAFVAVNFAMTETEGPKLKGSAPKTDVGMVQLLFASIVESAPLQLVGSSTK